MSYLRIQNGDEGNTVVTDSRLEITGSLTIVWINHQ